MKFAKERVAFGKPIGAFEGVSFKIAQMATDLDAARLLVYRAAALADAGKPFAIEASKAKLFASTAARKHASEAVQIHGGYGYTTEFPVERYYRDAKITEIYEGTSEIQHIIIARSLLGNSTRTRDDHEPHGVSGERAVSPRSGFPCRASQPRRHAPTTSQSSSERTPASGSSKRKC